MTESPCELFEQRGGLEIYIERVEGDQPRYHVEGPVDRLQSFWSLEKARLYCDVYAYVGGFREEKTGERGAPPTIAMAREDVLMAYYAAQPSMSIDWVAGFFDEDPAVIRRCINNLRQGTTNLPGYTGDSTDSTDR